MTFYKSVNELHIEPTRKCNARCPMCPRHLGSSPIKGPWVNEIDIDINLLTPVVEQLSLNSISINGNYGDIVMHKNPKKLIELCCNNAQKVTIHTNGGAQPKSFWKSLGKFKNLLVIFAIDGLNDTHSLYRRNTRFDVVLENAKTYIEAGGTAMWDMLIFKHNEHQVTECKELAAALGFKIFQSKPNSRFGFSKYPVHDKNFNTEYYIESINQVTDREDVRPRSFPTTKQEYQKLIKSKKQVKKKIKNPCIDCRVIEKQSIFISADNRVWPCCWLAQMANKAEKSYAISDFIKYFGETNTIDNFDTIVRQFDFIKDTWNTNPFYECSSNCNSNEISPTVITAIESSKFSLD